MARMENHSQPVSFAILLIAAASTIRLTLLIRRLNEAGATGVEIVKVSGGQRVVCGTIPIKAAQRIDRMFSQNRSLWFDDIVCAIAYEGQPEDRAALAPQGLLDIADPTKRMTATPYYGTFCVRSFDPNADVKPVLAAIAGRALNVVGLSNPSRIGLMMMGGVISGSIHDLVAFKQACDDGVFFPEFKPEVEISQGPPPIVGGDEIETVKVTGLGSSKGVLVALLEGPLASCRILGFSAREIQPVSDAEQGPWRAFIRFSPPDAERHEGSLAEVFDDLLAFDPERLQIELLRARWEGVESGPPDAPLWT